MTRFLWISMQLMNRSTSETPPNRAGSAAFAVTQRTLATSASRVFLLFVVAIHYGDLGFAAEKETKLPSQAAMKLDPLSEQLLWLWRDDLVDYERRTKDPASLRPQAVEFIRTVQLSMLPLSRGPGISQTVAMGKELMRQGCNDPLVKSYYGVAISKESCCFDAIQIIIEALNAFRQSDYPRERQRVGIFLLFSHAKEYSRALPWPKLREEAIWLAANRVGDTTLDPNMRRAIYYELIPLAGDECGTFWEDITAIHEECSKQPNADPWLIHMLAGRSYMQKAWRDRGSGWAYKVTDAGWEWFEKNLCKASDEYAEAMRLYPENPEAASDMIAISMGLGSKSELTPQEWFDKSVAAQFDYMPAYYRILWALRPRWGGSHDEMYAFGCKCADSKRYDTPVPFILWQAVQDIDKDADFNYAIWRTPGVYERVKQMIDGMAAEPLRQGDSAIHPSQSELKALEVALGQRAAHHSDARQLLNELGDRFDRRYFNTWQGHSDAAMASIYAFGGEGLKFHREAEALLEKAARPFSTETLEQIKSSYQKAYEADDNVWSQNVCRTWIKNIDGRIAYGNGEWFARTFQPQMLGWYISPSQWTAENEHTAVGNPRLNSQPVWISPELYPLLPIEIEFDMESMNAQYAEFGFFLFEQNAEQPSVFFVRPLKQEGILRIGGEEETAPCETAPSYHFQIKLSEKKVAFSINDDFNIERIVDSFRVASNFRFGSYSALYPDGKIRISNIRMKKWEPSEDAVEKDAAEKPAPAVEDVGSR